jgi:tRNA1(Val) A37 N6-methylase TrmN6
MGSSESGLPLTVPAGREATSDTLLLAEVADSFPCRVCFDLGTGTGEVFKLAHLNNVFKVGVDCSSAALSLFAREAGQPVLCSVEDISSFFKKGCADLVLANPPYNTAGNCRTSPDTLRSEAREGSPLLLYRFIFAGAHLLRPSGCMIITGRKERTSEIELGLRAAGFDRAELFDRGKIIALKALLLDSGVSENRRSVVG